MKKITFIIIISMMLIILFGCMEKNIKKPVAEQKKNLKDFILVFNEFEKDKKVKLSNEELNAFVDITPEAVFSETACQVFKNGKNCESYLLCEGTLYTLGIGFGGLGLVDMATSDFDNNGKKELLYTYSWGSGLHRSCIGCFDLSTKSEKQISYISKQNALIITDELAIEKISNTEFNIYKATVTKAEMHFIILEKKREGILGKINFKSEKEKNNEKWELECKLIN